MIHQMTNRKNRNKNGRNRFFALFSASGLAFGGAGFLAGEETQNTQNWKGDQLVNVSVDLPMIARKILLTRNANSLYVYYYDYTVPLLAGVTAYRLETDTAGNITEVAFLPVNRYASRLDPRWLNDFRGIPSVILQDSTDVLESSKSMSEISAPIPVRDLALPAGRVVLKFDRKLSDSQEIKDISDQMLALGRELMQ